MQADSLHPYFNPFSTVLRLIFLKVSSNINFISKWLWWLLSIPHSLLGPLKSFRNIFSSLYKHFQFSVFSLKISLLLYLFHATFPRYSLQESYPLLYASLALNASNGWFTELYFYTVICGHLGTSTNYNLPEGKIYISLVFILSMESIIIPYMVDTQYIFFWINTCWSNIMKLLSPFSRWHLDYYIVKIKNVFWKKQMEILTWVMTL